MQCPKPLNREITEAEPVSCLSAMASAMLLGIGLLPPDARFTRSCAIDVSLALFLPLIGTYSFKVGSEENPEIQANTLKSSHGTTFCTLSIVKSDANGGQGRFSFGISCTFWRRINAALYRICKSLTLEFPSVSVLEFTSSSSMVQLNLASQGLYTSARATAKTLVDTGHVTTQILGGI
jgi:hypothetical protein